jgi:hypothetical protein
VRCGASVEPKLGGGGRESLRESERNGELLCPNPWAIARCRTPRHAAWWSIEPRPNRTDS